MPAETNPSISEDTRIKTTINRLLSWGIGLIIMVAFAVTLWNKSQNDMGNLSISDQDQDKQLDSLQAEVRNLRDDVRGIQTSQKQQLDFLIYLANDRRGPKPDAAK